MTFKVLASSSHGNAYIVSDGITNLLLECGVSYRKLQKLLDFKTSDVHGCLVTHEHQDHAQAVRKVVESGVPVYMTRGTAEALDIPEKVFECLNEIKAGVQITVGSMDILPFETFHDAREPVGFCIQSREDGDIAVFATDTVNLPYDFPGVTTLAVEANYQADILDRCERMPDKTKHRITNTHMEVDRLVQCLQRMDLSRCREIILLHLSDATSHEGQFIHKVMRAVPQGITVTAAGR